MGSNIEKEIIDHAEAGTLLHAIFHDFGRSWLDENDPAIGTLARLHNEGKIELLAIVTRESIQPFHGQIFWGGQRVYRALISRLRASAEAILFTVKILIETAGQDMAAAMPVEEFSKWCGAEPTRPRELLELVDRKVTDADRFLTIAIKQGVLVDRPYFLDRAFAFLTSGSDMEKQASINALGQIACVTNEEWDRLIAAFTALQSYEDTIRAALITALARQMKDAPEPRREELTAIGIVTVQPLGDYTLDTAARTLAFDPEHLPEGFMGALLSALQSINGTNKGTVEYLDLAMMKLVQIGQAERARVFLEPLLRRDDDRIELETLDSLCYQLRATGGQVLEDWVVTWLIDGDYDLGRAMNDALFGGGNDEFAFNIDFTRFALREDDHAYVARKAIATFFLKQNVMVSLLVSLLRSASSDAADAIVELLIDPILINYAGIRDSYLAPIAADDGDPAQAAVQKALTGQDDYLGGLQAIGKVPELHPSERERQLEWQRHADSMSEAWRSARKKSIFASIATESLILHGTRAVSWFKDRDEDPRRIETQMGSFSTSFEVPRIDIVDPMGLQMMLMQLRSEKRPQ